MKLKKMAQFSAGLEKRVKASARQAKTSADKRRVMRYINVHPHGWADEPSEFFQAAP